MSIFSKINWVFSSAETLGELYNVPTQTKLNFYFEDPSTGTEIKNFLPSVGQTNQKPPFNDLHKDDPDSYTDVILGKISYYPQFYAEFRIKIQDDYLCFKAIQTGMGIRITAEGISNIKVSFKNNGKVKRFLTPFNIFIRIFANQSVEYEHSYQKDQEIEIVYPPQLHSVLWNLCLDNYDNLYVPVSRGWVKFISNIYKIDNTDGPLMFNWDQSFAAILTAKEFPELSQYLLDQLMNLINEEGFIPQLKINKITTDITNPPILFLAIAYYFAVSQDKEFLKVCYPNLLDIKDWWERNRRVSWNPDLFTWGGKNAFEAGLESGWDNSPLWEKFKYSEKEGRFETADTMATGFMILVYRILEILASPKILNKKEEFQKFGSRRKEIVKAVEEYMWNSGFEAYLPVNKDRSHLGIITPGIYYPGFTGELNKDRFCKSLKYLNDPNLLGGNFMIPTLSRSDDGFNGDGDYWRGRIWPPVNFLVTGAIANYSKELAEKIMTSSKKIFKDNIKVGISGENYSSVSGSLYSQPGVYSRNCPVYVWGGLLFMNPALIFSRLHLKVK